MDNDVDYELDYEQIISSKMMSCNDYISINLWYEIKLHFNLTKSWFQAEIFSLKWLYYSWDLIQKLKPWMTHNEFQWTTPDSRK